MSFIHDFISFARGTSYDEIPPRVLELAKRSIIDTIGVTCYGARSGFAQSVFQYVTDKPQRPEATAVGLPCKLTGTDAAFVNGFLSHLDDFDEGSLPGHTAVVLSSVALALGEQYHISGRELLRAYCIGFELDYKLARLCSEGLISHGWCDFSVLGTVAAAALAGILMGLDDAALGNAMAISASKAAGIMANFGTATKPYHVAMAAEGGIQAAKLAQHGLTGSPEAFEGENGFFSSFTGTRFTSADVDWTHWLVEENGMVVKKYPCCFGALATIDVFGRMIRAYDLTAERIQHVEVLLDPYCNACMAYPTPQNVLQAKFSLVFPMAELLYGGIHLEDWRDEQVQRPEYQDFYRKVTSYVPEKWTYQSVFQNCPVELTVTLTDGTVLRDAGEMYFCTEKCWDYMVSDDELREKFRSCTSHLTDVSHADRCFDRVLTLDQSEDTAEVLAVLGL